MKAIVWVERTECNNTCDYCIVFRRGIKQADVSWEKWAGMINHYRPEILDITGGEPFLNPHIVDIIKGIDPQIKIGLTTNLTKSILRFINEIPPSRIINITLSYHPSQRLSRDAFLGKALLLKNRGYPININFVTYPEQLWLLAELKDYFEVKHGIRFHVDPYSINPGYEHAYTDVEIAEIKKYVGEDRGYRFNRPASSKVICSAGHDYGILEPDGSFFRCMTQVWKEKGFIGNIFDPAFSLHQKAQLCDQFVNCAGCDMDKVMIGEINSDDVG